MDFVAGLEFGGQRLDSDTVPENRMNRPRLPACILDCAGVVAFFIAGSWWLVQPVCADQTRSGVAFKDEPAAHKLYEQMIQAIQTAGSLSYVSEYEREAKGKFKTACTYRVWLKKPNFFRMQTVDVSGKAGGVLIGDGERLWIYWPNGRPKWEYVPETEVEEKTRLTSYLTKPAVRGEHSILHEAVFLGGGMSLPILDASTFHGHVDSIEKYLEAVRSKGTATVAGEDCDVIEVSLMDHQRSWTLWLSKRDRLPRKLEEIARVGYDVVTRETWSMVTVDGNIPDSQFAWTPPANWQEWRLPDDESTLLKPGSMAPGFDLASVDGKRIRLADYKGKTVWLCCWRVGCPPCREELPYLQELYVKHKDEGFVVLGINVSDDRAMVSDFLRKQQITFPSVLDTSEAAATVCSGQYGGGAVPMNYLIDGDGLIIDAWFGHSMIRATNALKKAGINGPEASEK